MATTFFVFPGQPDRAFDANGDPVPGAKRYFYEAGTTTPVTVYSNTGLTTAHASPQIADGNGYFAPAYVSGPDEIKVSVYDASDNLLYTIDYVTGQPVGGLDAASVPFTATARVSADDAQEAIEAVDREVEIVEAGFAPVVTTGSTNAYLLNTAVTSYTAYATGDTFVMEASFANTAACTVNVDSVGAKSIKFKTGGSKTDPASGEIQVGHVLRLVYDGTDFVVTDHWRPMATQAEAEAGTAQGVMMDALRVAQAITAQAFAYTEETEVASTSGTAIDFTGIPAGCKRITVMADGVSSNGTNNFIVQIGDSGGIETTGYAGSGHTLSAGYAFSSGFAVGGGAAAATYALKYILTREDATNNTWTCVAFAGRSDGSAAVNIGVGTKALSAELDRVRLGAGGDTFDAGGVNISYEV